MRIRLPRRIPRTIPNVSPNLINIILSLNLFINESAHTWADYILSESISVISQWENSMSIYIPYRILV